MYCVKGIRCPAVLKTDIPTRLISGSYVYRRAVGHAFGMIRPSRRTSRASHVASADLDRIDVALDSRPWPSGVDDEAGVTENTARRMA